MTMEWTNRNDRFDLEGGNGKDSLQEHNECMKEFCSSRADVATVNELRLAKLRS